MEDKVLAIETQRDPRGEPGWKAYRLACVDGVLELAWWALYLANGMSGLAFAYLLSGDEHRLDPRARVVWATAGAFSVALYTVLPLTAPLWPEDRRMGWGTAFQCLLITGSAPVVIVMTIPLFLLGLTLAASDWIKTRAREIVLEKKD